MNYSFLEIVVKLIILKAQFFYKMLSPHSVLASQPVLTLNYRISESERLPMPLFLSQSEFYKSKLRRA